MLLTLDGFMSKLKDAKTTMTSGTAPRAGAIRVEG
jgi:hypothetical protein